VILQFQPTGICVSLALPQPMTLGRGSATNFSTFLDLTDLGGVQHGVSRHHAQLRRDSNRLMIQDLGSTNGTFLNELRLIAHKDYLVQHCARVRLGTLDVVLAFSDLD
jgi:pSer/pThr/pTyr-binding forkhead associated (FHA) protein